MSRGAVGVALVPVALLAVQDTRTGGPHAVSWCAVGAWTLSAALVWNRGTEPTAFHGVVTDLTLAEISGLDVARRVSHIAPQTFVVLISGRTRVDLEVAAQAGVNAVVEKPFGLAQLAEALGHALKAKRGAP